MERLSIPFDTLDRVGTSSSIDSLQDGIGGVRLASNGRVLPPARLTRRERQIIETLALGWSNKRIASELSITQDTVKYHLKSSYRKLGVRSRMGAVCAALQLGLINFP
jgi:DNA-binding NarL/FixJ family response regulator